MAVRWWLGGEQRRHAPLAGQKASLSTCASAPFPYIHQSQPARCPPRTRPLSLLGRPASWVASAVGDTNAVRAVHVRDAESQTVGAFESAGWRVVGTGPTVRGPAWGAVLTRTGFSRAKPPAIRKVNLSSTDEVKTLLDDVK